MFMDADDVLLPGALEHLLGIISSRPDVSMVAGCIMDWVPEVGFRRAKPWPSKLAKQINRSARLFRAVNVVRNVTPVTGCAVMNTRMAQSTAGFPDSTAEDWTFGVSMSFRGRILLSDQYVKLYRWRADGLSKAAIRELEALYQARRTTRRFIARDVMAPRWIKAVLPLVAVLHLLELPMHILREKNFSNVGAEVLQPVNPVPAVRSTALLNRLSDTPPAAQCRQ